MAGNLLVGTSGFAFKEWKGSFYPEAMSDKKMLQYYSQLLRTVEINYTFRRMPSEPTLENWRAQVGDDFRFTLKAPQRITHFKKLRDTDEDVAEFVRRARLLGDRLGTILFQLPPTFRYERDVFEPFLASLPPVARYAMEFRHGSWRDQTVMNLLTDHGVACCGADTEETPLEVPPLTAPHAYLRLRKEDYSEEELELWGARIRRLLNEGTDVFCYFKHEGGGIGPRYALAVQEAAIVS
ncbi:MAG: DUF72 domain-containing protein [Actinomycetota bacterium]